MKRTKGLFTVMLMLCQVAVFAQAREIKGTVKDSKTNETLPGVTILVEGTSIATTTDAKGEYSINVEGEGKKLVFSSVGYLLQTVAADKASIDVMLVLNTTLLKETVVTALGVSKEKKALGYSVSEVSGDDMRKSGEGNVIEALAAKAPGLNVIGSGGTPGASSKVTIRGANRFSGDNQPLIVIDGVPMDNSTNPAAAGDAPFNPNLQGVNQSNRAIDINPDDIESVSILKGPAAAALYGSRAGNGAIIYTTKRGKGGKGLGVTYSTSMEMAKVNKLPELQTKYGQGKLDPSGVPVTSTSTPNSWGPEALNPRNPYDDFFKTGYTYNNNVAVYGGNETTSLRLSLGNTNQTGVIPNTDLKRTTVRITADSKLTTKLTAGGTVDYTNTAVKRAQNGSNLAGVMLSLTRTPSSFDIRDYENEDGTQKQYYIVYDNPLYTAYKNPNTDQTNRVIGNVYLDYQLNESLGFLWRTGTDVYTTGTQQVYAISSVGDDNVSGLGQVNKSTLSSRNIYSDFLVRYNKKLTQNIGFEGLLGYNFTYDEGEYIFARGRNLQIPDYYNLNNASELYSSNSSSYQKTKAVFLDAAFDYKGMFYLTLTGRNEWSTAFGKGSKGFFYPKADISWVFSESVKLPKWFSFGKARAAYSIGGLAPETYSDKTYYRVPLYTDGFTQGNTLPYLGQSGYTISTELGNADLKPETVTGLEGGLDLRFLEGHITVDIAVYNQTSKNLLIRQPIAASSGFTSRYVNAGEMVNNGVEIALGIDPIQLLKPSADKFIWNLNVGWSKNKNKVTKLANGVEQFELEVGFGDPGAYAIVGEPMGVLYGSAWLRNDNGDLLVDASGLPKVDPQSKKIGDPNPDWLMNINNSFTYKSWNFSFLWDIRHGGDIWNGTSASLYTRGKLAATEDRNGTHTITGVYDAGTPLAGQASSIELPNYDGSGADYYTYIQGQNGPTENSIEDGSWVRLRSIGLSYRFDLTKIKKKTGFKYVELGVSGRNALLFTKYSGVDPETSLTGAGSNIGAFDYFNNPNTKSLFFNLKVGI
ncbi:MAG TPA: SusC/RagA family TonB-linked outer membrane protein [Bacteroidia bacterium]